MRLNVLLVAALALGCAGVVAPGGEAGGAVPETPKARGLVVREARYTDPEVAVLKSLPPQFEMTLLGEMPTPGFTLEVDAVEVDDSPQRIRAMVTEHGPTGVTSQVLTKTPLRLSLGTLTPGNYILELWLRRDPTKPHTLHQVILLTATP